MLGAAKLILNAAVVVLATSSPAWAYVDPGLLSSLYQAGYVLLMGAAAAYVFRPWSWLVSLFKRKKRDSETIQQARSDK